MQFDKNMLTPDLDFLESEIFVLAVLMNSFGAIEILGHHHS